VTVVAELWEEVTQVWAAVIVAEACIARAEKMAQQRVVLLATACGEANEVAQGVSILEDELVTTRWAQDVAKEEFPGLAAKAAAADRRRVAIEEQCERLVH
jgi:Flp pilus assembly secretin CpaC